MNRPNLSIVIPVPQAYDYSFIDDTIKNLKETLVYLETPVCRRSMVEEARRAEVKRITDLFRNALKMKEGFSEDPLYA